MKVNISTVVKSIYGAAMSSAKVGSTNPEELEDLTVKAVCINALLTHFQDDAKLDGAEKYSRYKLATKVSEADGEIDFTAEEIVKIKLLVGKLYPPTIVGRVFDILEGK